jgi:transporter family-2 protein
MAGRRFYGGIEQTMKRSRMTEIFFMLLAFLSGAVIAVYIPMNAQLSKFLNSAILTNVLFFLGAFITSVAVFAVFGGAGSLASVPKAPPHLLLTGIAGAAMIFLASVLVPRLGASRMFMLLLAGQLIMAVLVSHFGLFGSPRDPVTWRKAAGAAVMIVGSILAMT